MLFLSCMGIVIPTVASVDNGHHGNYDILMVRSLTHIFRFGAPSGDPMGHCPVVE